MSYDLIKPNDPRYFSQTCDKPYDRHRYNIVFTNGQTEIYDDWQVAHARWFQSPGQFLSHMEVVDVKPKKKSKGGFA